MRPLTLHGVCVRFTLSTKKGKDGPGLDVKTGLGLARVAGSMYLGMMTGGGMMGALNLVSGGNLKGMGMLGSPMLMSTQVRALGVGRGADPTATAASMLMQQAMSADMAAAAPGGQPARAFDGSLGEALEDSAKSVADSIKKAAAQKK